MPVPFLDLAGQHETIRGEVRAALDEVIASQQFILGPTVGAFEEEISAFLRAPHAVSCASGTDALYLALAALDLQPGDAVLTTPFTFFASAGAIARTGARPRFADIDPASFNIAVPSVREALESHPDVRAILIVHIFGRPCLMDDILALAAQRNIPVIEDTAQAFGALWGERPVGTLGRFGAFSFYPTKNLGGWGDGGLVTATHEADAERLRRLRVHGTVGTYLHAEIGLNSRLDALQAAVLRVKLHHVRRWNELRAAAAARYEELFREAKLAPDPLTLPGRDEGGTPVWHQYVVRLGNRDDVRKTLTRDGIGSAVYYPFPMHLQPAFRYLGGQAGDLPVAEQACREVLALPIFPEITSEQQSQVVDSVRKSLR